MYFTAFSHLESKRKSSEQILSRTEILRSETQYRKSWLRVYLGQDDMSCINSSSLYFNWGKKVKYLIHN